MPLSSADACRSIFSATPQGRPLSKARARRMRRPSLVRVNIVEHCPYIVAIPKTAFPLSPIECLGRLIIPPAFAHEFVPDNDLVLCRLAAFGEAPFQGGAIIQSLQNPLRKLLVGYAKEIDASLVESDTNVFLEVGMKFAGGFKAHFVEHTPEINDSADFFVWAAGIFHQGKDG